MIAKLPNRPVLILCLFLFAAAAVLRIFFMYEPIKDYLQSEDDWNTYARNAIDICENGLLITNTTTNYLRPAGFMYNYFVAAIFSISGNNPVAVFFVQALLLGLTVYLTFLLFRDSLQKKTAMLLLTLLVFFAFIDFFKNYTFMLLSENLAVFTLIFFFYTLKIGLAQQKQKFYFLAGFLLGITVLSRPTILPFSLIFVAMLTIHLFVQKRIILSSLIVILSFLIVMALLPIRNFLVTNEIALLPVDGHFFEYMKRMNNSSPFVNPAGFLWYYFKSALFIMGFPQIIDPVYNLRPHWLLMWIGFFLYMYNYLKFQVKRDFVKSVILVFVVCFHVVLLLIAQIENYGFRMLLPSLFLMLGLAVEGFEKTFSKAGT